MAGRLSSGLSSSLSCVPLYSLSVPELWVAASTSTYFSSGGWAVIPVSGSVAKSMMMSPASTLPEPPLAKVGMVTEIATWEPSRLVKYSY